jgi:Type II secretion system (T2SS), protein E, N-terminal domain
MRLGELLIADGRLTDEQVEQGLRAQVLWGGRLGTNLVELGLLDLDELSWALARLHRVPVALARHFAQLDTSLQHKLGSALAEKWQCVPLARLADDPPRFGVAVSSPLSEEAIAELAAKLEQPTDAVVIAIAAEMRILYHLERAYGIARPARYMRTRDGEEPEPPPLVFGESSEAELELPPASEPGLPEEQLTEPTALSLAPPDTEISTGPEHRRYMPMVGDEERRVGRIAIRRVKVYSGDTRANPGTWQEALRAIRGAHDRDRVGDLAVSSLLAFCPGIQVCVLLVVRGQAAIGWRGGHRDGALDVRSIAVPLDQPSGIAAVVSTGEVVIREHRGDSESDLDQRLGALLGASGGARVVISPISLSERRVACVLFCQFEPSPSPAAEDAAVPAGGNGQDERIVHVVASMRSAFLRLIRAASR